MSDLYSMYAAALANKAQENPAEIIGKGLGQIFNAYNTGKDVQEKRRLEKFFEQEIPEESRARVAPGLYGKVTLKDLAAMEKSGIGDVLRKPKKTGNRGEIMSMIMLASGGDPVKAEQLTKAYSPFMTDDDDGLNLTGPAVAAAKYVTPPPPTPTKDTDDVPALRAQLDTIDNELKGDIDEDRRAELSFQKDAIGARLLKLGRVALPPRPKPKPKPKIDPATSTKLGLDEDTKRGKNVLSEFLSNLFK